MPDQGPAESLIFLLMLMDSLESINRPRASKLRPGVRVEPFEFTSNGRRGSTLSRRVKSPKRTFYEVINIGRIAQ